MPTRQKLLTCPSCTFVNSSSFSNCKICNSPLMRNEEVLQILPFEDEQSKTKQKSWLVMLIFVLCALVIGGFGLNEIILNYLSQNSLSSQQKILNQNGDIKVYDAMKKVPNVPAGIFNYGGATCFAALQRDGMNAAIDNAHPKFQLRYVEPTNSNPGCTTGIQMLLDRDLTIAQNSRPLTETELAAAKLRGFKLESVPIAIDGVVFYVNKSLGIKSLSVDEIRDIYRGKITNWQELGGKNVPIVPISLDPEIDSILQLLMETEGTPLIDNGVIIVRDYTSAIRKTSATTGAISYGSAAIIRGQRSIKPIALAPDENSPAIAGLLADGSVNQLAFEKNLYPITRSLSIVFRRDGTPNERAAVAYINLLISQEGQKIVEQAGMISLYYNR